VSPGLKAVLEGELMELAGQSPPGYVVETDAGGMMWLNTSNAPQEVSVTSSIQVPPVTGMTPARVAQELRVIIRDQLWAGIKGLGTGAKKIPASSIENYRKAFENQVNNQTMIAEELATLLVELREIAKARKPSQTTAKINAMLGPDGIYFRLRRSHSDQKSYGRWAYEKVTLLNNGAATSTPAALAQQAERAYALVQALPTTEGAPTDREQTVIRAFTAMLKVYYGLDVSKASDALPDVMPALLAALRPAEAAIQMEDVHA
jgi:hypothetical protein